MFDQVFTDVSRVRQEVQVTSTAAPDSIRTDENEFKAPPNPAVVRVNSSDLIDKAAVADGLAEWLPNAGFTQGQHYEIRGSDTNLSKHWSLLFYGQGNLPAKGFRTLSRCSKQAVSKGSGSNSAPSAHSSRASSFTFPQTSPRSRLRLSGLPSALLLYFAAFYLTSRSTVDAEKEWSAPPGNQLYESLLSQMAPTTSTSSRGWSHSASLSRKSFSLRWRQAAQMAAGLMPSGSFSGSCSSGSFGSWNARSLFCDDRNLQYRKTAFPKRQLLVHDHFCVQEVKGNHASALAHEVSATHHAFWSLGSGATGSIMSFHIKRAVNAQYSITTEVLVQGRALVTWCSNLGKTTGIFNCHNWGWSSDELATTCEWLRSECLAAQRSNGSYHLLLLGDFIFSDESKPGCRLPQYEADPEVGKAARKQHAKLRDACSSFTLLPHDSHTHYNSAE